jgi:hypothetical protein
MRNLTCLTMLLALLLVLAPSCSADDGRDGSGADGDSDGDGDSDTDGDADGDTDTYTGPPNQGCTKMDILFVIDDSGSMGCEQSMLTQAFPQFVQVIEEYNQAQGNNLSYRLGVTSTGRTVNYTIEVPLFPPFNMNENGLDGELNEVSGLKWIDGPGNQSEIVSWFSDAADLGTGGPSYEMPLQCLALAIAKDQPGEANEGFLRDDSLFITVIITDEDDCSRLDNNFTISNDSCMSDPVAHNLVDLQEYKDFLDEKLGGPERYVVVTVAGLNGCDASSYPTTCSEDSSYAGAKKAERLQDFMNNYIGTTADDNGLFSDLCANTMADALQEALEKMTVACDEFPVY